LKEKERRNWIWQDIRLRKTHPALARLTVTNNFSSLLTGMSVLAQLIAKAPGRLVTALSNRSMMGKGMLMARLFTASSRVFTKPAI